MERSKEKERKGKREKGRNIRRKEGKGRKR